MMKSPKLKIGIIGCGAIGTSLAKAISRQFRGRAEVAALYDIDPVKSRALAVRLHKAVAVASLEAAIRRADIIVESARAADAFTIARSSLRHSKDILVMSVGGIAQRFRELNCLADRFRSSVFVPSGAICGLDGLKASSMGKIEQVQLTTIKPALAYSGVEYLRKKGINPQRLRKDTILFDGNAQNAIRHFPQNINVAAALSLAGVGLQRTRVRIIASVTAKINAHEIEIKSAAGRIVTRTENVVHPDNPKTSYLAVLSALAVLRQILGPVKVGT